MDENVKVAVRPAVIALFSFSPKAQSGPGFNTGGNFQVHHFRHADPAGSPTGFTGVGDHLPLTVALGACGADTEKSLGLNDLTAAVAAGAYGWFFPRFGSAAAARLAYRLFCHIDVHGCSHGGVHERNAQVIAQIRAGPGGGAWTGSPGATRPENIGKDIIETGKDVFKT